MTNISFIPILKTLGVSILFIKKALIKEIMKH